MLEELGDMAGARTAYERAERIRPDDFELELALGEVASRLGDREGAIRHLDRALALQPDSAVARAARDRL
jgi:Flp pilus assembly protein TadD